MSLWSKWIGRGRSSTQQNAASSVRSASENITDSAQAWFTKAEALAEIGHHEEALACYDRALAMDNRRAMALRGKALVLRKMKKPSEALEAVELALQVDPGLALAWRAKGAILGDLGVEAGKRLVCYERGLAIDPHDALLWCNKGNVLLKLERSAEAQASYQRALSIDPAFADAINGLRAVATAKNSEQLIRSVRREYLAESGWSAVEPGPSKSNQQERLLLDVSGTDDLRRWLSTQGFDLRKRVSGSSTLVGDSYEHFDHYKTSLWMGPCRLGDWSGRDHHACLVFEPDTGSAHEEHQREGWHRLTEVLAWAATQDPQPVLAKAFVMNAKHSQRLVEAKGPNAKYYNVCAACGVFISARKWDDCYKVAIPSGGLFEERLLLCEQCGDRMKQEMQ